jgi:aryl-alcohol dehydrogenase-like predicted oxidoreductase
MEVFMDRRNFMKTATVAAAGSVASAGAQSTPSSAAIRRPESPNMIYRELGRTGERVSAIGMGGYHIGKQQDPDESIRLLRTAIDRGITFMDNCWDYNGGISEVRMGQALRDGYRQKVFLMTKIDGRDKNTAARQIEQSLGRLQTDVIDLLQFHEVIRLDDPDAIFARAGPLRRFRKRNRRARFATSASPVTRIPAYICACLRLPTSTGFTSTLCRCPST